MLRGSVLDCSLHSVHEEEKPFELEICWISDATGRVFQRVPEDTLQAAEQAAKASLEESDMCAPPLRVLLLDSCHRVYRACCPRRSHAIQQTTIVCCMLLTSSISHASCKLCLKSLNLRGTSADAQVLTT